jgi:hypothetical protein
MMLATLGAAVFAALIAIAATIAIERFGGKLGGLLGSLPTTIVPASIGFWYGSVDGSNFENALFAVPVGMLVNSMFLYSWRFFPNRLPFLNLSFKLLTMIVVSIFIWIVCAVSMVEMMQILEDKMFTVSIVATMVLILIGIWACLYNPPAPKGKRVVSFWVLLARGLLAGAAIGISVWIAGMGIPLLAGIASVFPAIFLTTMVAVWVSQGESVQAGAVGPMMLGSASVSVYAVAAAFLISNTNIVLGCILSWGTAVGLVSIPAWLWLRRQ